MGDIKSKGILLTIYTTNIVNRATAFTILRKENHTFRMKETEENGYRLFPIGLGKLLSHKEAYSYLAFLFRSDYNTGESNVLLETLSNDVGYKDETVSSYLHKAEEYGYVHITRKYVNSENAEPRTKNFYKIEIPTKDFFFVSREFMNLHFEDIPLKDETDIKGFILLVKCICLNNCNVTLYSLRKMEEHLSISYATIQKYMSKCINLHLIERHKNSYEIKIDCFDKGNTGYFPPRTLPLYKYIYNAIDSFCQTKGVKAPPFNAKLIGQIAVKYPYTMQDLKQLDDLDFIRQHCIEFQLAQRLPNLSEQIHSLNYFVKVLTNKDYIIPPKKEHHTFIL